MNPPSRPPRPSLRSVNPSHPNLQPTALIHDGKEMFEVLEFKRGGMWLENCSVHLENCRTEARFWLMAEPVVDTMTLVRAALKAPDFAGE